jgi:uncharacterized protein (AIM24 family)
MALTPFPLPASAPHRGPYLTDHYRGKHYHRTPLLTMRYEIKHGPSYALPEVTLEPGKTIRAGAGAMTYMTPNIEVTTRMREASFLKTLGLKFLGVQSFFVNDHIAKGAPGPVGLVSAP